MKIKELRDKTVAVTGATGFIGRLLVDRLLASSCRVRILSRRPDKALNRWPGKQVTVIGSDLRLSSRPVLEELLEGAGILFHCAAELNRTDLMSDVHVTGTRKLCQAATGRQLHWVQLSSVGVYGPVRSGRVEESSIQRPQGIYETTKGLSDCLLTAAAQAAGFTYTILRPSIVFGPEMTNRSLFQMIDTIARGWFCFIGTSGAIANYIPAANVVDALICCAVDKRALNEEFILSDHRTMEEFVWSLAKALRRPLPRRRLPEKPVRLLARVMARIGNFPLTPSRVDALTGRAYYDSLKIQTILGYRHRVAMEVGLNQMVAAWQIQKG